MVAHHAVTRRYRKMCGERGDRAQQKRSTWDNEIEGALAEYWYASLTGVQWRGVKGIHAVDAGEDEVRWTGREDGNMLIYSTDSDSRRFVLVGGFAPRFEVIGWVHGKEAKQPRWFEDRWGLYRYPRHLLRPFSELAA